VGRRAMTAWGHRPDDGLELMAVFERNDALARRKAEVDDTRTHFQPRGTGEAWPAVITPPEPNLPGRAHPEIGDVHLGPRIDGLLTQRAVSAAAPAAPATRGGLAPAALRRVREYVNGHLERNIELKDLAAAAGLSPFHFARVFKQSEGMTPHEYVVTQR